MKIRISAVTLVLLAALSAMAQSHRVEFMLKAPALPDTAKVFITGSNEELGEWNPSKVELTNRGNHTWAKLITLADKSVEYKFTRGSWATEAANASGDALPNFVLTVSSDTTVTNTVTGWRSGEGKRITGKITGTVRYHRNLTGNGIKSRDLVVWLPEGYENHPNKRYPVLYMQDGQNIFDPATSSFGVDWQVDEAADSLIRAGQLRPFIVVGIYNTPDRMKEYIPGELGNAYMDFVANKVKPFIDSAYRTKPQARYTAVGGSSAGGIISFMLAWEHSNLFSRAICMSPAFKIQHIDYVKNVSAYTGKKKKLFFYIDNGGIALEAQLQPGIDDMMRALEAKGYKASIDYVWIHDSKAQHNEAAWAKRIPQALLLTMPK